MLRKIGLSLLSAIFLVLAFPNPQISILAWIAFLPLFFAIDGSSPRISFFLSYLSGFFFFGGLLYWLTYVTKPGYFILIFYAALYFGLFGLFANLFLTKLRASGCNPLLFLIFPSLWVSLEFVRGFLFTGFPWCILGYTQYKNPIIIQISDITGSYGVSFVIIMVNFVIYSCLTGVFTRGKIRALKFQVIVSAIIMAGVTLYGYFALKGNDYDTGLRLSAVQGNIEQAKKWDPAYKNHILNRYKTLTKAAAKDGGDLIVWPETAVPGYLGEKEIDLWLKKIIKNGGIPLFLGAVTYAPDKGNDRFFNSALLFSADGNVRKRYDKLHLVPFGEYVPFESFFPQLRDLIDVEIGDFTAGKEFTLFAIRSGEGKRYKYGSLICFEDIFPAMAGKFVREGADFMINITNDAWFKESGEQLQHVQASVFRAVENRISVLRAANTGFSCCVSPRGIIEDSIHDERTGSMYIPDFKSFDIKISRKKAFYTKYGDVFAYICILSVLIFCLRALMGGKNPCQNHPYGVNKTIKYNQN
ncbi:MAG: apolipoprotein N-acyltransferase [Candidatus Omnitrophota bacterium]|nr:apolipoprotein N-acyltransferase [Candidatus Omnitrophota bacterium]